MDNNGIFTISTATGFLPSTASKVLLSTFIRVLFYVFFWRWVFVRQFLRDLFHFLCLKRPVFVLTLEVFFTICPANCYLIFGYLFWECVVRISYSLK